MSFGGSCPCDGACTCPVPGIDHLRPVSTPAKSIASAGRVEIHEVSCGGFVVRRCRTSGALTIDVKPTPTHSPDVRLEGTRIFVGATDANDLMDAIHLLRGQSR